LKIIVKVMAGIAIIMQASAEVIHGTQSFKAQESQQQEYQHVELI